MDIQMKVLEQNFPVVMVIMLLNFFLSFKSADIIL